MSTDPQSNVATAQPPPKPKAPPPPAWAPELEERIAAAVVDRVFDRLIDSTAPPPAPPAKPGPRLLRTVDPDGTVRVSWEKLIWLGIGLTLAYLTYRQTGEIPTMEALDQLLATGASGGLGLLGYRARLSRDRVGELISGELISGDAGLRHSA